MRNLLISFAIVIQEEPKPTPKKQRLSRADKARIESEELLKALGVTMEAGRQTRSSRRGTTTSYESPKPEPAKRKPASTPRVSKKAKIAAADQTDGTNHVEDTNKSDIQVIISLQHLHLCEENSNCLISVDR